MKILLVTQFFPPEPAAAAVRLSELMERLSADDRVEVVTSFPNYPTGEIPGSYRGKMIVRESWKGIGVLRSWIYATRSRKPWARALNHLSFALGSVPVALTRSRPDVLIVQSPPLVLAFAGAFVSLIRSTPLVVYVADLHPESAIALGLLRNRVMIRLADALADSVYRRARLVITGSQGMAEAIAKRGVGARKIALLRGGVDVERFRPGIPSSWRARHGLEASFVVLYAGTHGESQDLLTLIRAADKLRDDPLIRVVFVGEGPAKADLKKSLRADSNVLLLSGEDHEAMPDVVAGADVCVIPLKDLPVFSTVLPSKLFEAMGAGKPVIVAAPEGEATRLVRESKSGLTVPPGDADRLADAIRSVVVDASLRESMGEAGRQLAVQEFSRDAMATRLRSLLSASVETTA